ncbi:hypothetical protein AFK68_15080 [Hydrocoleum sp. CS-953]|uniref:hypothetical protein n=1 Tax=Hydrocoleum sp. CS-953 TaxID=1671698 RepID=UPI000B9B55CA|nr:hypothetical protein [Hydrocoleum sp. CS-953]OZH53825.1 hypothetical protein AFK68_15080 [Hydrocoleum sp. CS-953]
MYREGKEEGFSYLGEKEEVVREGKTLLMVYCSLTFTRSDTNGHDIKGSLWQKNQGIILRTTFSIIPISNDLNTMNF